MPLELKKLRIRYNGKSLPVKEEVFRIIAKELPIDISDKHIKKTKKVEANIKMRFSYEGLLFVHQPQAQALISTRILKHSKNRVDIEMSNQGTKSMLPSIETYDFIVNKTIKLTEKDLKKSKFKRVLAGQKNIFRFKNMPSISAKNIKTLDLIEK